MSSDVRVFRDTYVDSVVQMSATRAMQSLDGVEWAAAAMATPANLETLSGEGFDAANLGTANDLFLAVRGKNDDAVRSALSAGESAMFSSRPGTGTAVSHQPRTIGRIAKEHPDTNVAIVSVPGEYAALEAHEALSAGLDVLLFSDNVSLADEVSLKQRAARLGRLVMGPGAGTAMLGGIGLGFANVVTPGRVGVVAAAGTGAQEAMSLLDRFGVGVSCVIGLGGRDLSEQVGGIMAKSAIAALRADEGTDAIFLVSKPPEPRVADDVLDAAGDMPLVASLVGLKSDIDVPSNIKLARTLEGGALRVLDLVGAARPDIVGDLHASVGQATERLAKERSLVRGLFSGGTLCYEALVLLTDVLGPIYSNVPLDPSLKVPAPPGSHICLDLGEEEYTVGRPHPMIDPQARVEMLRETYRDPSVGVILLDVVLGYGSHPNPAGELAAACKEAVESGIVVVAYVLGTERDPQNLQRQRQILRDAGCIVTETAARAALASAAGAARDLDVVAISL